MDYERPGRKTYLQCLKLKLPEHQYELFDLSSTSSSGSGEFLTEAGKIYTIVEWCYRNWREEVEVEEGENEDKKSDEAIESERLLWTWRDLYKVAYRKEKAVVCDTTVENALKKMTHPLHINKDTAWPCPCRLPTEDL
ncbi:hypothetical protein RvY_19205 [Ramazzottius varieornatus]|uniref:Uncharacterized protein n=1 Tax=Ramazzottius varieornatus TaxID=947166 RepID=A0A1D1W8L8_RAMVA|nr:hypothetical protein RvY_19205 [Ramazzottius varieornatus]